jgi:hypothetical protein
LGKLLLALISTVNFGCESCRMQDHTLLFHYSESHIPCYTIMIEKLKERDRLEWVYDTGNSYDL